MWYVSIFDARKDVSLDQIQQEREKWLEMGKDKFFIQKCKRIERFEVIGSWPLRIIFVIETDDPRVLNLLSHHFGNLWNSVSYPVTKRSILEALEGEHFVIGG
ncbi:MAG: hypothetical protein ACK4Z9_08530 [Thermodesulfovibrionales bacterium]